MPWVEVFAAFLVCHVAGDYLAQTEFQAMNKHEGLGRDPVKRRALAMHILTYTLCFAPVLIWIGGEVALAAAAGIAIPHAIQDDGRATKVWMERVKRTRYQPGVLAMAVDQSFHVVSLFTLAVVVGT